MHPPRNRPTIDAVLTRLRGRRGNRRMVDDDWRLEQRICCNAEDQQDRDHNRRNEIFHHNTPTRIATPRARQPSSNMVCKNFVPFAPVCCRPGGAAARGSGNSSTSRQLIAIWSDRSGRSKGSRAMIGASASAARAFGKEASRAASSQGSKPSRVKPETTLSGIPFCSLPIAAKRKSLRSEWSSENRADSAMLLPGLNRLP